jgi:hypothetical protein
MERKRKTTCSKCNKPLEETRLNQRYCKACHAENMRLNRPKHSELTELQRKKANCRSYLNVYIKRGNIVKQPCCVCGDINAEAHHEDYDKPLEIIWYCRKHHLEHHKNKSFEI